MRDFAKRALFLCLTLTTFHAFSQQIVKGKPGMYPLFADFKTDQPIFNAASITLTDETGKPAMLTSAIVKRLDKDALNEDHHRYQQLHNGIPVEHAIYIIHVANNKIVAQNGKWIKDFPSGLAANPSLTATAALDRALGLIGARQYKWQVAAEEAFLKKEQHDPAATFYPKAELVYYSGEEEVIPSALRLAYKFDIYAHEPGSRTTVFVDAVNGKILGKREMIHTVNAAGTATTAYSGTQSITTDNTGATYRLRETGRGNGIQTLNMKTAGTSYAAAVDFTDADNNWNNVNANKDQYATDAHWGAEKTYDYYFSRYGRNSVDNAGLALLNYVHVNLIAFGYSNNINAFWDGTRMSFGDGGTSGTTTYLPLTALDITGHEISHGVTQFSSGLTYSGESGAMNEGFSDIFGTAIEFYGKPASANWLMGENIGAAIRNMSNPNQFSQPDTYQGTFWYTGTADHGGVHTNSGVLNYWFYLVSQGGSGTNDKGTAFNVTGIGIDKAGAIAYRLNTFYLVSTSNYASARTYGIKAAEDLYGMGSAEAVQTANAFTAVGIGSTTGCNAPAGLTSSVSSTGAVVSWPAVSGAASYAVDYKTTASITWTSAATATTLTSVTLSGLTAATTYDWRVRTNCAATNSAYTQAQFTTIPASGCGAAFEPNETLATAAAVLSDTVNSAAISSATDIDYFKITTTATGNIVFNLVGPAGVDYDLYIYNSAGTQIGAGEGSTATEAVTLSSQAAGTYYIKVIGYNGASSASCYTIKASAPIVTSCQSSYDVSTNGTIAGAALIPFNTNITGLISPSGDDDYYKFTVTTAGTITITLTTLPANYDLRLYSAGGTQLVVAQLGGTNSETISGRFSSNNSYYLRVSGASGASNATSCYTLKAQLGTATFAGISAAPGYGRTQLKLYPNPATDMLNVSIQGAVSARATLQVSDAAGKIVMEKKNISNEQSVDVSRLSKGVYLIKLNDGSNIVTGKFIKQ